MPQLPFSISGTIYDSNSSALSKATVKVYNLRTGENIGYFTESDGKYIVDLADSSLKIEYANLDPILIRACKEGQIFRFAEKIRTLLISEGMIEQDLTVRTNLPQQPKEIDNKSIELTEHNPIANAKKVIVVNESGIQEVYSKKMENAGTGQPLYIGETMIGNGNKTNEAVWRIRKMEYNDGQDKPPTGELWADGNANFDKKWNNRSNYSFS